MSETHPVTVQRYTSSQMMAHWLIVALVLFQWLTGDAMGEAFGRTMRAGGDWVLNGGAIVHGLMGTTILGVMIWRALMRRRVGAPPPPETEPAMLQKVSRGVHFAFYALLIALPILGILAWITGIGAFATLHELGWWILLVLVLAHVAGAAWHAFKRDGVVSRMAHDDPSQLH